MKDILSKIIANIFDSSSNNYVGEEDNIALLFSNYNNANDENKKYALEVFINQLNILNKYDIKKWCLIFVKLISFLPISSECYEYIIDLLFSKNSGGSGVSEGNGKKLGTIIILNNFISKLQHSELPISISSKLLFFIAQLINDQFVGIIASLLLSKYLKQLLADKFKPTMVRIIQLILNKTQSMIKSPNLYLILLSLKEEHKQILVSEKVDMLNFQSENELINFINILKKFNNTEIVSVFFNEFAVSNLFEMFWNLLIGSMDGKRFIYSEQELLLTCLVQTICPVHSGAIDLTDEKKKLKIIDTVWNNSEIWKLFFSHITNDKSLFHSFCRNVTVELKSNTLHMSIIIGKLFEYFLSFADKTCHLIEANVPASSRLSQVLIRSIRDSQQLIRYINLLNSYLESDDLNETEKLYIIEQFEYTCHSSTEINTHNVTIDYIIAFQTRELYRNRCLSDILKRCSFSALISCIHHSVTTNNTSMNEYLLYLKSVINIVVKNLSTFQAELKITLQFIKSLSKYIDDQLEIKYNNPIIIEKVFPCFGSIICYLSLFLLSSTDLRNCEKSLRFCDQIIDWIKQCFQAANKSIECYRISEIPTRKRMLSISSLCSDDGGDENETPENSHWTCYLIDILLKVYDEDSILMNKGVNSIVSLMIRTKTLEISAVRYLKNLMLSENARRKKINEFELVTRLEVVTSTDENLMQDKMKSWYIKERCLNILSPIILENNDVDMIASCLFIVLDICSAGDKKLTFQVEKLILDFKTQSNFSKEIYLNSNNTIRAINTILNLSNDASNYENFVKMASNIIIGLISRTHINEEIIKSLASMMRDNLYGSISNFQKSILQNLFLEQVELAWHLREILLECVQKTDSLRLAKYKAFCIIKNIVNSIRVNGKNIVLDNYNEFVLKIIPAIVPILLSFNLESLNVEYASIVLECFTGLYLTGSDNYKISENLLLKLNNKPINVNYDVSNLINKFLEIYKLKNFNLQMISLEKLQEYDNYMSYLLNLLPVGYNKDLNLHAKIMSKTDKPNKETKTLSKFGLVMQSKKNRKSEMDNASSQNLNSKLSVNSNVDGKKRKITSSSNRFDVPAKKKRNLKDEIIPNDHDKMPTDVKSSSILVNNESNRNSQSEIIVKKKKKSKNKELASSVKVSIDKISGSHSEISKKESFNSNIESKNEKLTSYSCDLDAPAKKKKKKSKNKELASSISTNCVKESSNENNIPATDEPIKKNKKSKKHKHSNDISEMDCKNEVNAVCDNSSITDNPTKKSKKHRKQTEIDMVNNNAIMGESKKSKKQKNMSVETIKDLDMNSEKSSKKKKKSKINQ